MKAYGIEDFALRLKRWDLDGEASKADTTDRPTRTF